MIIIGLPFLRKTMNMYVLMLYNRCIGDYLACTLGGAIPRASSAAIKNACLLTLHWCYEVYSRVSVTLPCACAKARARKGFPRRQHVPHMPHEQYGPVVHWWDPHSTPCPHPGGSAIPLCPSHLLVLHMPVSQHFLLVLVLQFCAFCAVFRPIEAHGGEISSGTVSCRGGHLGTLGGGRGGCPQKRPGGSCGRSGGPGGGARCRCHGHPLPRRPRCARARPECHPLGNARPTPHAPPLAAVPPPCVR